MNAHPKTAVVFQILLAGLAVACLLKLFGGVG